MARKYKLASPNAGGYIAVQNPATSAMRRRIRTVLGGRIKHFVGKKVWAYIAPLTPGKQPLAVVTLKNNKVVYYFDLDIAKMNSQLQNSTTVNKKKLELVFLLEKAPGRYLEVGKAVAPIWIVLDEPKRPWYANETQQARSRNPLYQPWAEALDYLCTQAAKNAQTLDEALTRVLQYVWKSEHLKYDAGGGGCWFSKPLALYDPNPYRVDLVNRIKFYRLQDIPNALYDFRKMLSVLESRQQTTICNCCDCACTLCTLGALAGASNRLRITGLFAILRSDATWRYLIHDDPTKVAPFHRPNDQEILTKIRCIGDVAINFTFGWHAYTVYQNKAWDLTMKLNNNFIVGMEEQAYLEGAMNRKVPSNRLKKRTPTIFFMR